MSDSSLRNLRRRYLLIAILVAAAGIVLFNMTWYMVASALPAQVQGMVMVTAALLIAFASAKAVRGGRPMFPPADDAPGGLSAGMSAVVLVLVVGTMLVAPAFILWLVYR